MAGAFAGMNQPDQVAAGIVGVGLQIIAPVGRVARLWPSRIIGGRCIVVTAGTVQVVERVVAELAMTVDALVGEMAGREGMVVDANPA